MSVIGSDTFTGRTVTGSWGTASDGHTWIQAYGAGTLSVGSGHGQITANTGINTMLMGAVTGGDVDIRVRFTLSSTADTASVTFRSDSTAQNCYRCRYTGNDVAFTAVIAGATTAIHGNSIITITPGNFYWFHVQAIGTTLRYNFWAASGTEPAGWMGSITDTTFSSGLVGVHAKLNATSDTATFDSFQVASLTDQLDLSLRARVLPATTIRDVTSRARVSSQQVQRDLTARARLLAFTSTRNLAARARLLSFGAHDLAVRASIDEALLPLPSFAVPQISVQIGTTSLTPLDGSFSIGEDLSGRSTCQFSIHDPTGTFHVLYRQKVLVTHSVEGVIFRGFVSRASERNLTPNPNNTLQISCIDEHWLADKRAYEGDEFSNQRAGVAAAFAAVELADEGVSASAAIDYDTTQADFGAGILTNVVAAANEGTSAVGNGDLELAAAGQGLSIVESSLSDFVAGTLTSLQANGQGPDGSGFLSLLALWGIIYSATATVQGGGNLFTYNLIWSTPYTIASGDQLFYEVWIASTSPESKAGVDLVFTDGTTLRDFNAPVIVDQQGIPAHPNQDISFLARDKWYARTFSLTPLAGKTTAYATLAFEGDQVGAYTAYFRHIFIITATGTHVVIFDSDQLALSSPTAQQLQNNGYSDVSLQVGVVFEKKGQRISPAYPLDQVGIARQSLMSWTVTLITGHTLKIEASLDGGVTWQTCTSAQSIPGVVAGMRLSGQSLMLRETLTNTSSDPTQTSFLFDVTATIQPSYISDKSDVVTSTSLLSQWNTGSLTNCQWLGGALSLIGFSRYWFSASLVGQTTWGSSSPVVTVQDTQLQLQSGTGASCITRMDFAGQWQNFICETDINVTGSTSSDAGIVYRTTGWQNANNTYAYMASIKPTQILLGKGTNSASGAGVFTQIGTATLTLTAGDWHRLKVVVNGNTHQVYLDNVLYITATDSTYPGLGYIGLRHFNGSGSTDSSRFDSFGVVSALSGTRVSQPVDLSGAMAVQDSYFGATTSVPAGSSLLVEASVDNQATWYPCVNGANLSALLPSGMPLSGVSLVTRVTLTTTTATALPTIAGMTTWIVGVLSSSGSRISPPLSLSQVSRVGNSVLGWQANLANDATTLGVDVSTDGKSWMDVSTGNGLPIPLFAPTQDPPFLDTFSADMTASYISTSLPKSESNPASWTVNSSTGSLTATGGLAALLVNPNQTATSSGEMILDLDTAENAGAAWQLSSNYSSGYMVSLRDDGANVSPNRIRIYRIFGGVPIQLGLGARLNFKRGTLTRFKVVWLNGTITVTVDGGSQQTLIVTDPNPLTDPGLIALRANGGTQRFWQWRAQNYGDDVSSQLLYTRLRLATTDPLYTPQVLSLTAAIYGPTIGDGALIPITSYSVRSGSTNTIAQDLDDLARQSNYWWRILNGILYFQPTTGLLAPWIATGQDILLGTVDVTQVSDLYRNEQIIIGGTDIEARSDVRVADGLRQGFDTGDTIESIDSIVINDQSVSFGLQGVDTGKDWYYQQGQKGITQSAASSPLPVNTTVVINYQGIIPIVVKATHVGQVALLASLDGTSGKVTVVEKADGLTSAAAQHLAVSRVSQYAVLSIDLSFTTLRRGLHIGQLLTVFLPQHGLSNQTFLITKVDYAPVMSNNNGQTSLLEYFTVEATSGPIVGSWVHMFS